MGLFLTMNAADYALQLRETPGYIQAGSFPISQFLLPLFETTTTSKLIVFERVFWWAHIGGILGFLNYLYYSKHLHILLAFPNTFYANLNPKGQFKNNSTVTQEVQLMLDPNADPYAAPPPAADERFGAADVTDSVDTIIKRLPPVPNVAVAPMNAQPIKTGKSSLPEKL